MRRRVRLGPVAGRDAGEGGVTVHIPALTEIETISGRYVDVAAPRPETIHLDDIAHALANTCRYNGHTRTFYSVAEHAVLVADRLRALGHSPVVAMAGLHHDDAEAYLGDVVRPLKLALKPTYTDLERRMHRVIREALAVAYPGDEGWQAVVDADNWALAIEARCLMQSRGEGWHDLSPAVPGRVDLGLSPADARSAYLWMHDRLTTEIARARISA